MLPFYAQMFYESKIINMEYFQVWVFSDESMMCALKSPGRRKLAKQLAHFLSDQLCEQVHA